jgi:hypothetical protein
MTPQQIVGLAVRLFAIWLALVSLQYVWAIPAALAKQNMDGGATFSLFIGLGYIVVAALLWFFPMTVAHRLIPRTSFENVLRVAPTEAARVGSCLLGLWLLLTSGPALVNYLFRAFLVSGTGPVFSSLNVDQRIDLAYYVVQVVISVILIVCAGAIASRIMRPATPESKNESL